MRLCPAILFLFVFSRVNFAAGTVNVIISHFGPEGDHATLAEPTSVEVTVTANKDTNRR